MRANLEKCLLLIWVWKLSMYNQSPKSQWVKYHSLILISHCQMACMHKSANQSSVKTSEHKPQFSFTCNEIITYMILSPICLMNEEELGLNLWSSFYFNSSKVIVYLCMGWSGTRIFRSGQYFHRNHDCQSNLETNLSNFDLSSVAADGIEPFSARTGAASVKCAISL